MKNYMLITEPEVVNPHKATVLETFLNMPRTSTEFLKNCVVLRTLYESESFCRKIVHREELLDN
jgi:hypothetical protein